MDGPDVGFSLELSPQQTLSQLAIQTIALLGEPQHAVDARVEAALLNNPALRRVEIRRCRWCARTTQAGRCLHCSRIRPALDGPQVSDPRDDLRIEAHRMAPSRLGPAIDLVIDRLDDRGLLAGNCLRFGEELGFSVGDIEAAIGAVRLAGPAGIAEVDSRASLLAQARWHAENGGPGHLPAMVRDHLEAVASDCLEPVAAALGVSIDDVVAAARFLRTRLTPAPFTMNIVGEPAAPPDLIVTESADGTFGVEVLGARDLGLELDPPTDADLLPDAEREWWEAHVADARDLIQVLDRRATTLRRVGIALTELQVQFIRLGRAHHRRLSRSELAVRLGLHPSTVSRAVRHAVAALPGGRTVPLSEFFGGAVAARECLAELLESDDPPASDREAAARLAEAGFTLARRTVAKYRLQIVRSTG